MASSSSSIIVHPVLALSPVRQAFSFIDWTNSSSSSGSSSTYAVVVGISRPQAWQLQHAQEQPLEYIASDYEHAFSYVRTLLQVLDHVTGPSPPGRILKERLNLIMGPPPLLAEESTATTSSSMEDAQQRALEYLRDDPRGVMTHSILTQLYDFIGVVLTIKQPTTTSSSTKTTTISTLFYQPSSQQSHSHSVFELREDWRPLLRILYRPGDAFCQQYAATILMTILMGGGGTTTTPSNDETEDTLKSLISWIISQLQSSHSHTNLQVVLPSILVLCTCGGPHTRRFFFGEAGGIGYLSKHLRRFLTTSTTTTTKNSSAIQPKSPKSIQSSSSSPSVQQVYEVLFCLWTMILDIPTTTTTTTTTISDEDDILLHSLVRDGTIRTMMHLLAMAPREKIVRMTLRMLAQLVLRITTSASTTSSNHHPSRRSAILSEMLVASRHHHHGHTTSILETLKSLQLKQEQQQWDDIDMKEDLKVLTQYIQSAMEAQTNWEVYQAELESGCLQKGVVHTEVFWKTHVRNMEGPQGDFAPVRRLIHLIAQYSASQAEEQHHYPSTYPYNGNGADNNHDNGNTDLTMLPSEQDECVSMALYDLGEFVRWYPNGKSIATRLGAKAVVLPLLNKNNQNDNGNDTAQEVQRQALVCISKLLVNNWQAIS